MSSRANKLTKRREPFTFMLYLGIFGSGILFMAIFLIFLKKEYINQNIPMAIPGIFWLSTLVIVFSSLSFYLSKKYLENQNFQKSKAYLAITFFLGLLFMVFQMVGWYNLAKEGKTISTHTGASFLIILSGLHILHTVGGIVALSRVVSKVFGNKTYIDSFVYSVNPPNQLSIRLVYIYWHFIDFLWLIIFLFLLYHAT
jgi:cytochrome c oxidase subunit 3